MKALCVDTGRLIDGLGDAAPQAMFAHTTVGAYVEAACNSLGVELTRLAPGQVPLVDAQEPVVVLASQVFLTSTLLKAFVKAATLAGPGVWRLAVRKTPAVEYALPLQQVPVEPLTDGEKVLQPKGRLAAAERAATEKVLFDVYLCTGADVAGKHGTALLDHLRGVAKPALTDKREMVLDIRLPLLPMEGRQAPTLRFPVSSSVVVQLRSWVHVLWLNQLAPGILINLAIRQRWLGTLWRVLKGFSLRREDVLQRLSVIHPTARVHPTAYVEASIIGANAVVGARASVRESVISEGAEVADHSTVISSSVGRNAYITPKTFVLQCCIHEDAVVGNQKLQVSLVGRGALLNAWAAFIDARFQGGVKVEVDGKLEDTTRSFLGSCVGHGAQVTAKVLVHPGRVVPAGTVVVMRPDEVISRISADLPTGVPLVRDNGELKPLSELKKRLPA